MNNIEKIKAEIKRLYKEHSGKYGCDEAAITLEHLEDFIDSLPEEKPSEDLNKLIQKWDRIDINTVLKVKVKATGKVIDGFYDGRGHFDHFIDHDVFDRYSIDEVELISEEKPSKGLDVTDFCKPIDPGIAQCIADHWWEMLGDKESDKSQEEAAITYSKQVSDGHNYRDLRDGFIAGDKWGAEQFAKIVRANLPEIGKDAQSQFEQLYFEITGNKMYGGYND